MFRWMKCQQPRPRTVNEGSGGDHFREEFCIRRAQAKQIATVTICPGHHGSSAEDVSAGVNRWFWRKTSGRKITVSHRWPCCVDTEPGFYPIAGSSRSAANQPDHSPLSCIIPALSSSRNQEIVSTTSPEAGNLNDGKRPYILIGLGVAFFVIFLLGLVPAMLLTAGREQLMQDGYAIAVLPFANLTANPGDERLARNLFEGIIDSLSGMPQLRVSQQNSTLRFRDHPADLQAVAEFLDVTYVLEGSLARVDENVVVVSRLLRIGSGEELAVLELKRAEGDLAGLEAEISLAVMDALSRQVEN